MFVKLDIHCYLCSMIVLYRIYQIFIMLPVAILATIVVSLLIIIGCSLGGGRWWGYYPAVVWGKVWCWFSLVKVSVSGRENIDKNTSYVFVSNHQGAYDIFSIYGYLGHTFRWMMKKSLEKIPFVGFACRRSGQIFVDNSSPVAVRQTMAEARERLKGGMSLVVFPEGTRSRNGKMLKFKKGAYQLATQFGLPIVPITIDGAYDVLPKDAKLPRWGHIKITIHKPVPVAEEGVDVQTLMDATYDTIHEALSSRYK